MKKMLFIGSCCVFLLACVPEDQVLPTEFLGDANATWSNNTDDSLSLATSDSAVRTLRSFGAQADANVDDTEAIKRAFQSHHPLDGEGLSYRVQGAIRMEGPNELRHATLVDNGLGETPMSIEVYNKNDVVLDRVTFDRGTNPEVGDISRSRTLSIIQANNVRLKNLTFFGHGRGTALCLIDVTQGSVDSVTVRDMGWKNDEVPNEQLIGMWLIRTTNVTVQRSTIQNLYEIRDDGTTFTRETDGITFGGSSSFVVADTYIQNVGEGIDITGSDGNTGFEIRNCVVKDAYTYGIKCSNSAYNGKIYDSEVHRAGYACFVFEGPSEENLPFLTRDIQVYRCTAYDAGSNGHWPRSKIAGFLVQKNKFDKDYPQDIGIYYSKAIDNQDHKTMKYGFYSEIENVGNRAEHNDSYGHIYEGEDGFN